MNPFRPIHNAGTIVSSASRTAPGDAGSAGFPVKAVVLVVYYPEDDDRSFASTGQSCITCDVRTIGLQPRYIPRVPVFQRAHGLFDEDLFVPRPASQDISGGSLSTEQGSGTGVSPTPAELTDASVVLVGFLDGSPAQPFIYPAEVPHLNARNLPAKSDGRVKRIRHSGVLMEWSEDGDWTLDATGAAKQTLGSKGTETSNSGTTGVITVKTSDGSNESSIVLDKDSSIKVLDGAGGYLELDGSSKAVLSAASVLLGSSAATEPVLKGSAYVTAESTLYGLLAAAHAKYAIAWAQVAAKLPVIDTAGAAASAAGDIAAGLTAWSTASAASKSTKVKTS